MAETPLIIVDIFAEITTAMAPTLTELGLSVNYTYGRQPQILSRLQTLNNSISTTQKSKKYPLIALFMPFKESYGSDYVTVRFPKIVIAALSNLTDTPEKRYEASFKPILYPVLEEFIKQIAYHKRTVGQDTKSISYTKQDNPGSPPPTQNGGIQFADYVDAIEIYDLNVSFRVNKNCN